METQTKYQPRVERATTKLWVPHNAGEVAMAHPLAGPDTYRNVGKQILDANQRVPTGDYTASLLHVAYCSDVANEPEFENIRDAMRKRGLWVFNVDTWTDKGVYSMKDLKALGLSNTTSIKHLEAMLEDGRELSWGGIRISKDGKVGFAPKGSYRIGEHTSESLARDGLVVVTCNEQGAKKIGEIASKFKLNPKTYGVNVLDGQSPVKRVSAVYSGGDRLGVGGVDWGDYGGFASGVLN